MISINFPGKLTLGMKIIYGIVAVGIIGTIIAVIAFNRSSYLANTMRLVRTQGDVRIVSAGGGSKAAAKNKRFESGDVLVTGVNDSLASVSLDDSKIVTLQADSKAEFVKKNKQIELKLTKGALFFEVVKKLNADETYEIKTSTLTAGIRGTSGYIYYDEQGNFHPERRLGCLGCPLAQKAAIEDFKQYPNLLKAWLRAGLVWWETHPNAKSHQTFGDIYELLVHNLFYRTYDKFRQDFSEGLFKSKTAKEFLEDKFGVSLSDLEKQK